MRICRWWKWAANTIIFLHIGKLCKKIKNNKILPDKFHVRPEEYKNYSTYNNCHHKWFFKHFIRCHDYKNDCYSYYQSLKIKLKKYCTTLLVHLAWQSRQLDLTTDNWQLQLRSLKFVKLTIKRNWHLTLTDTFFK